MILKIVYSISLDLRWYMIFIHFVVCFISLSLGEERENAQRLELNSYAVANHNRFFLSDVLLRLFSNLNLFQKKNIIMSRTTHLL